MSDQDRPGFEPPLTNVAPEHLGPMYQAPAEVIASGPRRSRIGTGIAIAAIGIGGIGVVGTAYASSATPTPSPSADSPAYGNGPGAAGVGPRGNGPMMGGDRDGNGGHGPGGMRGGLGLGMGMGMAIHATAVMPKQGGGFQTVDTQQGTVDKVSATSITVTSEDKFSATYVVNADTIVKAKSDGIGAVKPGDSVSVVAIENGGSATAVTIIDRTQVAGSARMWGPAPKKATTPTPSASGTA